MEDVMKRYILSLIVMLPALLSAYTVTLNDAELDPGLNLVNQSSSGITLTYSMDEFQIEDTIINGDTLQTINVDNFFLPGQAGAPDIPSLSTYITRPQGSEATFNVTNYKTLTLQNIDLAPAVESPLEDDNELYYFFDENIYTKNEYYPSYLCALGDDNIIRGVDCNPFAFMPFSYNPVTKELKVCYDIIVTISFSGGNGHFGEDRLRSRWWEPINRMMFINYNSLPDIDFDYVGGQRPDGCEYLIICPDEQIFIDYANLIKEFRVKQGISTEVVSFPTTTNYLTIEGCINTFYASHTPALVAFLILGDYEKVVSPTYVATSWDDFVSDNIYADYYNNELPDMIQGRITASNEDELFSMVNAFIDYETSPPLTESIYEQPVLSGGWDLDRRFTLITEIINGFLTNELGKSPNREYGICQNDILPPPSGWGTGSYADEIAAYFDDYLLVDNAGDIPTNEWYSDYNEINERLDAGANFLIHRDHGNYYCWGAPYYQNSYVDYLSEQVIPFIFSVDCLTGEFWDVQTQSNPECLAQKFHRFGDGALGIIAPTEASPSYENDVYLLGVIDYFWDDFMNGYNGEFDSSLMPAIANAYGKYYMWQSNWGNNIDNYKEIECNLYHHHGDAFLELCTEVPDVITAQYLESITPSMAYLNVYVEDDALVCLSYAGEDVISTALSEDGYGHLEIEYDLEAGMELDLVITKRNHIRYTDTVAVGPEVPISGVFNNESSTSLDGLPIRYYVDGLSYAYETTVCNVYYEIFVPVGSSGVLIPEEVPNLTIDPEYYEITSITTPIYDYDFNVYGQMMISGNIDNLSSTSLQGMSMNFYNNSGGLITSEVIDANDHFELSVLYGTSGRLEFEEGTSFVFEPPFMDFGPITEPRPDCDFVAYEVSQVSEISGTVSMSGGNGDVTDVTINVNDSAGLYATLHPDVNGGYSIEITPPEYGIYYLNFELMPLNGSDDDYYKLQRELTVNCGDDHTVNISLVKINPAMIIVNPDTESAGFHTFNSAIDYLRNMNQYLINTNVSIVAADADYNGHIDVYGLESLNLTIRGINDSIIDGMETLEHGIAFYNCDEVELCIMDLSIINWYEGGFVENSTSTTGCSISIENCLIQGNRRTTSSRGNYGGGIMLYSPCSILNNEITDNEAPLGGGGICISSKTGSSSLIEGNVIEDNISDLGGGILLKSYSGWDNTVDFELTGNIFNGNELFTSTQSSPLAAGIFVENIGNLYFTHNIVSDTPGLTSLTVACAFQHIENIDCINNTFVDNTSVAVSFWDYFEMKFINNIVSDNTFSYSELYPVRISVNHSYPYEVDYNCLYGNPVDEFQAVVVNNHTVTEDPCLDATFVPQWDGSEKSSCIDAGNPNLDGDNFMWWEDDDDCYFAGSNKYRMFIGAKDGEVYGGGHRNNVATLKKQLLWNWISIPAIDNYGGSSRDDDELYNILNKNMGNEFLEIGLDYEHLIDNISWLYNEDYGSFYWRPYPYNDYSFDDINHETRSQYGYKLKLSEYTADKEFLQYGGIIPAGYQATYPGNPDNQIHIIPPVANGVGTFRNDATLTYERETWLGYFREFSMNPLDALSPVLDDIVEIKAQHWCLSRILVAQGGRETLTYGDNWAGAVDPYNDIAINYGEMVAVRFIGDTAVDFLWGGNNSTPPAASFYSRELAEYFEYEEQEDYVPVYLYIDLDSYEEGNKPIEVAILVDEECKGAAVIKEKQVQLNAYILNDSTLTLENLEFVLYFPSRSVGAVKADYAVYDPYSEKYESRKATAKDFRNYLMVSLSENEEYQLPKATSLSQNYPNPFNPETRICFELEQNAQVKLEVYNLKGQKIITLVNDNLTAGYHSEIWRGIDDKGSQVSSGVYLYKLTTSAGDNLTKKMILMK
jgi:hypothetical protein